MTQIKSDCHITPPSVLAKVKTLFYWGSQQSGRWSCSPLGGAATSVASHGHWVATSGRLAAGEGEVGEDEGEEGAAGLLVPARLAYQDGCCWLLG